jgi:hypothetical protein
MQSILERNDLDELMAMVSDKLQQKHCQQLLSCLLQQLSWLCPATPHPLAAWIRDLRLLL